MMTAQGLQVAASEDSLAGLGIVTNGIIGVNIVFCICVAGCRGVPVRVQDFPDLFVFVRHVVRSRLRLFEYDSLDYDSLEYDS